MVKPHNSPGELRCFRRLKDSTPEISTMESKRIFSLIGCVNENPIVIADETFQRGEIMLTGWSGWPTDLGYALEMKARESGPDWKYPAGFTSREYAEFPADGWEETGELEQIEEGMVYPEDVDAGKHKWQGRE